MKAPAFWYGKRSLQSVLLSPFGQIYRIATLLRRAIYKPYRPSVPLICVGNIVAGGAGKTPTCLALHKLLSRQNFSRPIGFVTRGYGGTQKGPLRVNPAQHTSRDVGDEALLLAKVGPCSIGCDRAAAVREAEKDSALILMDDGLQNPKVAPHINLLVVDGAVGFGNQQLIPAGPLRETLNDAFSRIDAIVMIGEDKNRVSNNLGKPVFKGKLWPSIPPQLLSKPKVLAFAGIGRPQKFYDSCRDAGLSVVQTRDFPDHHVYTDNDLKGLIDCAERNALSLITTAKDFVRLPGTFRPYVNVLDVELKFENEEKLADFLLAKLNK